jgi:hypothetical protein
MGEIYMKQSDIDRLLNTIAEEESAEEKDTGNLIDITGAKIYKRFSGRISPVKGLYRSPVIKSEDIIYNPEPGKPVSKNKVVVRSLFQFVPAKGMA